MKRLLTLALLAQLLPFLAGAQEGLKKVYDETINWTPAAVNNM